ncbi:MAG: hypothetical protein ACQEVA_09885 [Myxococcota bacterium]
MSEHSQTRAVPLTWIWAVIPAVLMLGALGVTPLRSWDFWWHAAIGRLISATGTVPTENLFLYTMEVDHPSFIQPWLSQLLLYQIEDAAGLNVVLLLRNLLAGAAWAGLTWWATRRSGIIQLGALLALLVLPFGFLYIGARTHLFAWPLLLACLALCYAVRSGRLSPFWLLGLPAITAIWVNLHGSFVVPALVALAFWADALWARFDGNADVPHGFWLVAMLGALGASIANPHGLEVWAYLIELSSNQVIQNTLTEWMPVTLARPSFLGPLFYGLLVVGAAVFGLGRDKFEVVDALLFYGFAVMAALHARSLLWFALVLPVALAPCAGAIWQQHVGSDDDAPPSRVASVLHGAVVLLLVAGALTLQPWTNNHDIALKFREDVRQRSPMTGLVPADVPVDAIWVLKTRPVERLRLFHDHRSPGFLIYELQGAQPTPMVFVDNRVELPSAALWSEFERAGDADGWRQTFREYDINAAVLMTESQSPLIAAMEDRNDWRRLYKTDEYVVYLRR